MARLDDRHGGSQALQLTAQRRQGAGIDLVAPGQDHQVGPPHAAGRLTQQTARQQMAVTPGHGGIEQHQVHVTGQPAMLESVVEDQDLAFELLQRGPGQGNTIRPLQVRHVGQVLVEDQGLVIEPAAAAIAAAEDGDAPILPPIKAGHVFHHGRFARAAGGDIADADDGRSHTMTS